MTVLPVNFFGVLDKALPEADLESKIWMQKFYEVSVPRRKQWEIGQTKGNSQIRIQFQGSLRVSLSPQKAPEELCTTVMYYDKKILYMHCLST